MIGKMHLPPSPRLLIFSSFLCLHFIAAILFLSRFFSSFVESKSKEDLRCVHNACEYKCIHKLVLLRTRSMIKRNKGQNVVTGNQNLLSCDGFDSSGLDFL